MTVKVSRKSSVPSTKLGSMAIGTGFVVVDTGDLYIRLGPSGATRPGSRRCFQLTPPVAMGTKHLYTNTDVYPADINIEWGLE